MITRKKSLGVVIPIHRTVDVNPRLIRFLCEADGFGIQVAIAINNESSIILQNLEVDLRALNLRNVSLAVCDYANVGNARNIALQMLNTEWICFLDADDLLNLSNCLTLIDELSKEETDLIIGSIRIQDCDVSSKFKDVFISEKLDPFIGLGLFPAFTRIIYRNEFISGIYFPRFEIAEDQAFLIQVLMRNPRLKFSELNLYTYFVGNELQSTNQLSKYPDLALALAYFFSLFNQATSKDNKRIILVFMLRIYVALLKRFRYLDWIDLLKSSFIAMQIFSKLPLGFMKALYLLRNSGGISIE